METLAIGEVARRAGISTSAIRYYERARLLPEPERVGGKRRYEPRCCGGWLWWRPPRGSV